MALILPGSSRPTNLHLRPDQLRYELDGETLLWLEKLPAAVEGGDRLNVHIHEEHAKPYIITEWVPALGEEQFIMRTDTLDEKTFEKLRYMAQVPLHKRVEESERIAAAWKEEYKQNELDRLYDEVGGPMRHQLRKDGFVDSIGYVPPPTGKGKPK